METSPFRALKAITEAKPRYLGILLFPQIYTECLTLPNAQDSCCLLYTFMSATVACTKTCLSLAF